MVFGLALGSNGGLEVYGSPHIILILIRILVTVLEAFSALPEKYKAYTYTGAGENQQRF